MNKNTFYRQGDVGILATTLPVGAVKTKITTGRLVLAYGEVTGHAHAICEEAVVAGDVEAYEKDGKTYLRVVNPVSVGHEEHGKVNLPVGDYEIIHQREYHPEAIRNVMD